MLIKTDGVVLKYFKYSESSIIAHVYTEELGIQQYIISGVNKPNTIQPLSLFQSGNIISLVAYYQPMSQKINRIKEVKLTYKYQQIHQHIYKSLVVVFISDMLHKTITLPEKNTSLFSVLKNILIFIDDCDKQTLKWIPIFFCLQLLKHLGFALHHIQQDDAAQQLLQTLSHYDKQSIFSAWAIVDNYFIKNNPHEQKIIDNIITITPSDLLQQTLHIFELLYNKNYQKT